MSCVMMMAHNTQGKAAIVAKEKERDQATKAFQTTAEKFEKCACPEDFETGIGSFKPFDLGGGS